MSETTELIGIKEVAKILNRDHTTLRYWERMNLLPDGCLPHRNGRGWRFWTPAQIETMKEWMALPERQLGNGLPHYKPDETQLERHLDRIRFVRKARYLES